MNSSSASTTFKEPRALISNPFIQNQHNTDSSIEYGKLPAELFSLVRSIAKDSDNLLPDLSKVFTHLVADIAHVLII